MKFSELKDDSALDLAKQVERLRIEVALAEKGYLVPADAAVDAPAEDEDVSIS